MNVPIMGRRFSTVVVTVVFAGVTAFSLNAQDIDQLLDQGTGIPPEYEAAVIDLVERYEELRRILREQIQLNDRLYTEEEIDAQLADLRRQLQAGQRENAQLRRQYKMVVDTLKRVQDEELALRDELAKTRIDLGVEIETLEDVIASIEEENLFQLGPTFSASGRVGGIGIFNLPATNLSLVFSADYALRDRDFATFFGATFSAVPQRSIVEAFERVRARRERRLDARGTTTDGESPLDALRGGEVTGADADGVAPAGADAAVQDGTPAAGGGDFSGEDGAGAEGAAAAE